MSYSYRAAQIVEELTDSFERVADDLPVADVIPLFPNSPDTATPSLAECVPLLAIAIEYLDRGPASLSLEAIESYRARAKRLLEYLRPAIEGGARTTLDDWAESLAPRKAALCEAA